MRWWEKAPAYLGLFALFSHTLDAAKNGAMPGAAAIHPGLPYMLACICAVCVANAIRRA